jgi:hypothetical protein
MEDTDMKLFDDGRPMGPGNMREAVLKLLANYDISPQVAKRALSECPIFLQHVNRVRTLADQLDLDLSGFRSNDDQELYFDLVHRGRDLGFVYRGWDDPGFGIGEMILVTAHKTPSFMMRADVALRMLATRGIGVTATPDGNGSHWLGMTSVLYADGLNASTLAHALNTMTECTARVRAMLQPGTRP